jgi:hypothetical protein
MNGGVEIKCEKCGNNKFKVIYNERLKLVKVVCSKCNFTASISKIE